MLGDVTFDRGGFQASPTSSCMAVGTIEIERGWGTCAHADSTSLMGSAGITWMRSNSLRFITPSGRRLPDPRCNASDLARNRMRLI
jgi:hypothetical protein